MAARAISIKAAVFLGVISFFSASAKQAEWIYIVSEGDNLWNLSEKYLKSVSYFSQLQQLNQIEKPKNLQPGSTIRVPMEWIKHHPTSAKVTAYSGNGFYIRDNKKSPVKLGTAIQLGDSVIVDPESSVTITFADGTQTVIYQQSQVVFDHLSAYGETGMVDTRFRVTQGKVETRAMPAQGPGSRLDILSGTAISSVRGTQYRVASIEGQNAIVEVLEGLVEVDAASSKENIPAGFAAKVEAGKAPSKPIALLPAPELKGEYSHFSGKDVVLSWHQMDKAQHYKLVVAKDSDFSDVNWQQQTTQNGALLPIADDGEYFVKISAIDSEQIEGKTASIKIFVNNLPAKAEIAPSQSFLGDNGELFWPAIIGSQASQLEISTTAEFSTPVVKKQLHQNHFELKQHLSYGDYYWRIAGIDEQGLGPYSNVGRFSFLPSLATPVITWIAQSGGARLFLPVVNVQDKLVLQVARDSDFSQMDGSYVNPTTVFDLALENGVRYVRCRIESASGNSVGQWSLVTQVNAD